MSTDTPAISDDFRQRVQEAAAKLRSRGETASIRLVRAEMGGGSPNWIAIVLRDKRASQGEDHDEGAAEAPELAAARLLVPGLLESLRATIAAEFSDRLAAMQLDAEEAQARLREQTFAMQDIEAENEALKIRVEGLDGQLADQLAMMTMLKAVAIDVRELSSNQRSFEERANDAFIAAREERQKAFELASTQIAESGKAVTQLASIQGSIEHLGTQQTSFEKTSLIASQAATDRLAERINGVSTVNAATNRDLIRLVKVVRQRMTTVTKVVKRSAGQGRRSFQ